MTSKIMDAAYPPPTLYPGTDGALGYIGGAALHVWTPAEWQPFQHVRQFPCWAADLGPGAASAGEQGIAATRAARALGWAADEPGDTTRVIVADMETAVDPAWYAGWAATVEAGGFVPVCYGSASTVYRNNAADVWVADWVGFTPAVPVGQRLQGWQYGAQVVFAGTQVDLSVVSAWMMNRGGVGPRHG